MKKSKKILKIIAEVLAAVIVLIALTHNPVYYRLYLGKRVKGTVQVIVDGEVYDIDESNFNVTHTADKRSGKIHVNSKDVAKIKFRANKYGKYAFDIVDTPVNKPISISFYQANWWNVQRFNITISIDTSSKTIDYNARVSGIKENGIGKSTDKINRTDDYTQEVCRIGFGP